jgi:hypothetical protein
MVRNTTMELASVTIHAPTTTAELADTSWNNSRSWLMLILGSNSSVSGKEEFVRYQGTHYGSAEPDHGGDEQQYEKDAGDGGITHVGVCWG